MTARAWSFFSTVVTSLALATVACSGGGSSSNANAGGNTQNGGISSMDPTPTSGTAGAAGTTGMGGAAGNTIAPVEDCSGVLLTADGVLDLDLRAASVSGQVTLEGAPLPTEVGGRGKLVFEDTSMNSRAEVDLASEGPLTYTLVLPPGTYDVRLEGNPELCAPMLPTPSMPCAGGTLLNDVAISADGVLDVDIASIQVSGQITANGATIPDESLPRGQLVFAGDGSAATWPLQATGPESFAVTVVPGTYDVKFIGVPELCGAATAPSIPCNDGVVLPNLDLTADGAVDVDIPSVSVIGSVLLHGAPLPTEIANRGSITLRGAEHGAATSTALETTGPATYELTVLPGIYDVVFDGNPDLCAQPTLPSMPCNSGVVQADVSLTGDGVVDVSLSVVQVTGSVTLSGAPMPDEPLDRGSLLFGTAEGGVATQAFGPAGAVSYQLSLLAGAYSVSLVANPALCVDATPSVPCIGGPLLSEVDLSANGALDLDIQSVRVSGNITLNGGALPTELGDRGHLAFTLSGGDSWESEPLSTEGAGSYEVTLLPGSYDVSFVANPDLCAMTTPPSVPCNSGALVSGIDLTANGALDVDIPAVHIVGSVTLHGAQLPDEEMDRGSIVFAPNGTAEGFTASSLMANGAGTYAVTLMPGAYVVSHAANPGLCGPELMPRVPCSSQIATGCE